MRRNHFRAEDQPTPMRAMRRLPEVLRRPVALIITAIAASDVAYRLLLRAPIRRGLGIED
jgi:hypothetical protein